MFCIQEEVSKEEIADGPKVINVSVKQEVNPAYSLIINDLVPGLRYEIKVSLIPLLMCHNCSIVNLGTSSY